MIISKEDLTNKQTKEIKRMIKEIKKVVDKVWDHANDNEYYSTLSEADKELLFLLKTLTSRDIPADKLHYIGRFTEGLTR